MISNRTVVVLRQLAHGSVFLLCMITCVHAEDVPLKIGPRHSVNVSQVDAGIRVEVTAGNPHFWLEHIPANASLELTPVLSFDYFSARPIRRFSVKVRSENRMHSVPASVLPIAEGWRTVRVDLRRSLAPEFGDRLLFDFNAETGSQFRVRNFALVPPLPAEERSQEERMATQKQRRVDSEAFVRYLEIVESVRAVDIEILDTEILMSWQRNEAQTVRMGVVECPIWEPSYERPTASPEAVVLWDSEERTMRVPRFVDGRDRATSRWIPVIVNSDGKAGQAVGRASYATGWSNQSRRKIERPSVDHIKGVGGLSVPLPQSHPVFDLGVRHATVNIVISGLIRATPAAGWSEFQFEGDNFYLNTSYIKRLDNTIGPLTSHDILVSAILLVGNHRDERGLPRSLLTHPDARSSGVFAMPAMNSESSVQMYRAVIHVLAERYTRDGRPHGQIVNWIMHNEVNQAGTWTNMGDQPLPRYVESLQRSARLVYHTTRLFDPQSRIFLSLTHHWTRKSAGEGTYVTRDLLDLFANSAKLESDYEWGVAYHPYPEPMFHPDVWNNDVSYDFDSEFITPKNIEVLAAYMDQPSMHWRGRRRGILLSEQGVNALSNSDADQRLQAAGIVYAMSRIKRNPAIEAYHYHNFYDNPRAEGGLLLGLVDEQKQPKRAWHVYRAFESDREAAVFDEYWPSIPESKDNVLKIHTIKRNERAF